MSDFMALAESIAKQSICQRRQVGAVIVMNNALVESAYNSPIIPSHQCDDWCPGLQGLDCPVTHAELRVFNETATKFGGAVMAISNCVLYVTCAPCKMCRRVLDGAVLKKVYFKELSPNSAPLSAWKHVPIEQVP